ncbi:MAG: acyl-CoA thioesterase [Chloroflexi bacterium CFX4]|nr:acyl-CoA thioesterase [Chloroflexi bacterium CFX4]MDL1920988.1 acyl-CoA thioesterase [Chloroflexi bacterium CFX3]
MSDTHSEGRTVAESRVQLVQFMRLEHANALGNVHGGEIMKLVDEAGALAAMRHARTVVVTVTMDSMTFTEPIRIGAVLTVSAELTYVGSTSMEAQVQVTAENPITGERKHTNTAYLVYVALDEAGRPKRVPPLIATTDEERARLAEGEARQAERKRRRAAEDARQAAEKA